jgi:hypothetical protein
MGYIIGQLHKVKERVEFDLPSTDAGQPLKADFVVTFRIPDSATAKGRVKRSKKLAADYAASFRNRSSDPEAGETADPVEFEESMVREDVISIDGLTDVNGQPIPYSADLLDAVFNDQPARRALFTKWSELIFQNGAIQRKN